MISNKTVLDTKRGKNNPSSMFVKPSFAKDPAKKNLERVMFDKSSTDENVGVGAYDVGRYSALGD